MKTYVSVRLKLIISAIALLLVPLTAVPVGATGGGGTQQEGWCVPFRIPVSMGAGQPFNKKIVGEYCQPFKWMKNKKGETVDRNVDVMTSGAGYTREYWNWGYKPDTYSFTKKTLSEGRATIIYDRVGTGESSKPHSTEVTLASDAHVLHQVIQAAKILGYKKVNSFGHSYSSPVVIEEAATHQDVSRVILTGFSHVQRNPIVGTRNYPAVQDPRFETSGLDVEYLTSRPDTRGLSFYSSSADPQVIAYDEANKDIISRTAFLGFVAQHSTPAATNPSNLIKAPVLIVLGDQDVIFCSTSAILNCSNEAAVKTFEAPYFTKAKSLDVISIAGTGHDLNLHPSINNIGNVKGSFNRINSWIRP